MKALLFIFALIFVASAHATTNPLALPAKGGDQGGGGGDHRAQEFFEIALTVTKLLKNLDQSEIHAIDYRIKPLELEKLVKTPIKVVPVVIRNRVARSYPSTLSVELDVDKWQKIVSLEQKIKLVSHEILVLARLEDDGEYSISTPLSKLLLASQTGVPALISSNDLDFSKDSVKAYSAKFELENLFFRINGMNPNGLEFEKLSQIDRDLGSCQREQMAELNAALEKEPRLRKWFVGHLIFDVSIVILDNRAQNVDDGLTSFGAMGSKISWEEEGSERCYLPSGGHEQGEPTPLTSCQIQAIIQGHKRNKPYTFNYIETKSKYIATIQAVVTLDKPLGRACYSVKSDEIIRTFNPSKSKK